MFLVLATALRRRQMRLACVSCRDTKTLCELDCMMPTYRKAEKLAWPFNKPMTWDEMSTCLSGCTTDYETCDESTETTACISCTESCATTFDSSMLSCVQALDPSTVATFDEAQDDCATSANWDMSTCIETCHSEDVYMGWSSAVEEGDPFKEKSSYTGAPDYRNGIPYTAANLMATRGRDASAEKGAEPSVEEAMAHGSTMSSHAVVGGIGFMASIVLSVGLFSYTTRKH